MEQQTAQVTMMGWRGAIRSIAAAQRAAHRESARRQRQQERLAKAEAKYAALVRAAEEVESYNSEIHRLRYIHSDCGDVWDWKGIAAKSPPAHPRRSDRNEVAARANLEKYVPGMIDRLFKKRQEVKRGRLSAAAEAARSADDREFAKAVDDYKTATLEWQEMTDFARRVLRLDAQAVAEAVDEFAPFAELGEFGAAVGLRITPDGTAMVTMALPLDGVIPAETKTLLQSGKLSVKRTPAGKFQEICQDYVCGAVLRAGREVFALLPVEMAIVTATTILLDTASGHMRATPILSVRMPKETLRALNFEHLDASDSLRNFVHRIDFKKTKGFMPIEPFAIPESATLPYFEGK